MKDDTTHSDFPIWLSDCTPIADAPRGGSDELHKPECIEKRYVNGEFTSTHITPECKNSLEAELIDIDTNKAEVLRRIDAENNKDEFQCVTKEVQRTTARIRTNVAEAFNDPPPGFYSNISLSTSRALKFISSPVPDVPTPSRAPPRPPNTLNYEMYLRPQHPLQLPRSEFAADNPASPDSEAAHKVREARQAEQELESRRHGIRWWQAWGDLMCLCPIGGVALLLLLGFLYQWYK